MYSLSHAKPTTLSMAGTVRHVCRKMGKDILLGKLDTGTRHVGQLTLRYQEVCWNSTNAASDCQQGHLRDERICEERPRCSREEEINEGSMLQCLTLPRLLRQPQMSSPDSARSAIHLSAFTFKADDAVKLLQRQRTWIGFDGIKIKLEWCIIDYAR